MTGYAYSRQEAEEDLRGELRVLFLRQIKSNDPAAFIESWRPARTFLHGLLDELKAGLPGVRDEGLELGIHVDL